jgi:hypothetical protein
MFADGDRPVTAMVSLADLTDRFSLATGIYDGISNEDYHKGPGLSSSGVKKLMKSPAHYEVYRQEVELSTGNDTPAKKMGTALHTAVLEPDHFKDRVVVGLDVDRRSKVNQAIWSQFEAEHAGKVILPAGDYQTVEKVAASVRKHPLVRVLMSEGDAEQSAYCRHETGVLLKARGDWWNGAHEVMLDLKSVGGWNTDASLYGFARSAAEYGYVWSAGHYKTVYEGAGRPFRHWFFLAAEKSPPYGVALYELPREAFVVAEKLCRRMYEVYAACEAEGRWPCYPEEVRILDLPRWALGARVG